MDRASGQRGRGMRQRGPLPTTTPTGRSGSARVGMGFLMGIVATLLCNNVAVLNRNASVGGGTSAAAKQYTDDDDGGSTGADGVAYDLDAPSAAGSNGTARILGCATSHAHATHISAVLRDLPFAGSPASKVDLAIDKVLNETGVKPEVKRYLLMRIEQGPRAAAEALRSAFEKATSPEEHKQRRPPKAFSLDLIDPLRNHEITILDESLLVILGDSTSREFAKILAPAGRPHGLETPAGKAFTIFKNTASCQHIIYCEVGKWRLYDAAGTNLDAFRRVLEYAKRDIGGRSPRYVHVYTNLDGLHRLHLGQYRPYEQTVMGTYHYGATLRRIASAAEMVFGDAEGLVQTILGTANYVCENKFDGTYQVALGKQLQMKSHCAANFASMPAAAYICANATMTGRGTAFLNRLSEEIATADPTLKLVDTGAVVRDRCGHTKDARHFSRAMVQVQLNLVLQQAILGRVEAALANWTKMEVAPEVQKDARFSSAN